MATPNPERVNETNITNAPGRRSSVTGARTLSIIALLAGIWFFVSAWVYGAAGHPNAWNNWIVGGVIIFFACWRVAKPAYSTGLGWINTIFGIWAFFSPWIFQYTGYTGRFINSLCVGVIVFVCSIVALRISMHINREPLPRV